MTDLSALAKWALRQKTTPRMPALFVGHGNPMNAITTNPFASTWESIGNALIPPRAIVCISAHWQTRGTRVTAMTQPRTIHDFGGFPKELFSVQYPAPGSPELATEVATLTRNLIEFDHEWGLDHGTWSVLCRMFPKADIPVLQISLDVHLNPEQHVALANDLSALRDRGVLLVGSGNIVHNLRMMSMDRQEYEWAKEFDALSADLIKTHSIVKLARYKELGSAAALAIPTDEHYLPMLYALGTLGPADEVMFFNEQIDLGSVSMRSFIAGTA